MKRTYNRIRQWNLHGGKEEATEGSQTAFGNAGYVDGYLPPSRSHGHRSTNSSQRKRSDARHSSRKAGPSGEYPYPPQRGSNTAELNQQEFYRKQPGPELQDEKMQLGTWAPYGAVPNRNSMLIGTGPYGRGPGPSAYPPAPDARELSRPWNDKEPQRTEVHGPGEGGNDSSAVMGRMYYHLQRVKSAFPSAHFGKDDSYSPTSIEAALVDLIEAYRSMHQEAASFKEVLKAKDEEYGERILRLERENEREKYRLNTIISVLRDEHGAREQKHDDKLRGIQQEHDDKLKMLQDEHQSEKKAMTDSRKLEIQRLERDMELLRNKHDGAVSKLKHQHREEVAILNSAAKEEAARLKEGFDRKIFQSQEVLRVTKDQYKQQLKERADRHEEEKQDITKRLNDVMDEMNDNFHNEKARLSSEMESQRDAHEAELSDLRKQNAEDKQQMAAKHKAEKSAMEKRLEYEKEASAKSMQYQRDRHAQEMDEKNKQIEEIKKRHDAEKVELENKRIKEHRELRETVEKLKGALVKRDHFKVLSDHDLSHRFQDIASEVDDFARVDWDNGLEHSWPFPEKLFRDSVNERRTKQHIIQNTIWGILYEKIFCTPFRVLGSEGKLLEGEWLNRYGPVERDRKSVGTSAPCPKPTKDSEKWRYEALRERSVAITQPLMKTEPNYNVKLSYEESVREAIEDISRELEKVTSVGSGDEQRVIDIVRKSANLWLEAGQQRCRILLLMSPPQSGQASQERDGAEDLVVVPEVRRIGNAQGERLDKNELVSGCKGKFSVFNVG
ncbi:hypothetical protein GP486_004892 [Trichoglossum hirsutum]|uniref:Uncharacterized protein n=1 Tax=Trichoglossum hirsutum TaxID=265104 RepID=A0A9P8LAF0_9PEZI|nr:hypothetical protein GP486_004892 [Trichoglossum hirsutum]